MTEPHMVAVYKDQIYWTDLEVKAIMSANKLTGNDARVVR